MRIMQAVENQKIFSRLNEEQLVLLQQAMREHQVRHRCVKIKLQIEPAQALHQIVLQFPRIKPAGLISVGTDGCSSVPLCKKKLAQVMKGATSNRAHSFSLQRTCNP